MFGKELPTRSFNVPQFDRILKVPAMLVRIEKELNGLPSHKAIRLKSWNGGGFIRVGGRLNTMKASQALVDEGKRGRFGLEKEDVVVAAHLAIKSCQSFWSEVGSSVVVEGCLRTRTMGDKLGFIVRSNSGEVPPIRDLR